MSTTGRPRALDEFKQREICALISAGCSFREAARYVRCDRTTIQREARRNPHFRRQLDEAAVAAELCPLKAMQQAVGSHWRAAAWMLERTRPERYGRRDPRVFRPRQARKLLQDLVDMVDAEIRDPIVNGRVKHRLRDAIEEAVPGAIARSATTNDLREAINFFDKRDVSSKETARATSPADRPTSPGQPAPQPGTSILAEALASATADIRENMAKRTEPPQPASSPPDTRPAPMHDERPSPGGDPFLRRAPLHSSVPKTEPNPSARVLPPKADPGPQKS